MNTVIIGAGPAGLYAAIKLRQAGILDVAVYDPRAGHYTRPGHLSRGTFFTAQISLGIDFGKLSQDQTGHIKDLERTLYKEAIKLGIKIENKHFLRLHENGTKPGIVVAGDGAEEEIVEAEYVFDCTGARRSVVAAVNSVIPDSPLQLATITDLPVSHHFLAYVRINKKDWEQFEINQMRFHHNPTTIPELSFARSIIKLRALGWKEFQFPRCYGVEFGKDKVCLYLHAPEHLDEANYDNWVQTVLECYANPIRYTHLNPSVKPKPRFLPFTSSAQALQEISYKGKDLPTVIALGDTQIDSDYYLAHGIRHGMERIDSLLHHVVIFNNQIIRFDATQYMRIINEHFREHKEKIIQEAGELRASFVRVLDFAGLKFRRALRLSTSAEEQAVFNKVLKEIDACQSYRKARQDFAKCHNQANQVILISIIEIGTVIAMLTQIQNDLVTAYNNLPISFVTERQEVQNLLAYLVVSWNNVGDLLFQNAQREQGREAYKNALEIYKLDCFFGKRIVNDHLQAPTLISAHEDKLPEQVLKSIQEIIEALERYLSYSDDPKLLDLSDDDVKNPKEEEEQTTWGIDDMSANSSLSALSLFVDQPIKREQPAEESFILSP